uniref:Uncharacterized protein n=1 Tax=Arundo donax TaxID=35708 RepID=A0A0A9GI39_ARUDO
MSLFPDTHLSDQISSLERSFTIRNLSYSVLF